LQTFFTLEDGKNQKKRKIKQTKTAANLGTGVELTSSKVKVNSFGF